MAAGGIQAVPGRDRLGHWFLRCIGRYNSIRKNERTSVNTNRKKC